MPKRLAGKSPKLGVGSRSCAGKENRTEAISETPINLEYSDEPIFNNHETEPDAPV